MTGNLSEWEIENLLIRNNVGRIGCHAFGKTYIIPITYAYSGDFLIACSLEGMKIDMMRENRNICFEVDEIEDQRNWRSVICFGKFLELEKESDRQQALDLYYAHFNLKSISSTAILPSLKQQYTVEKPRSEHSVIFQLVLPEKTGRFEKRDSFVAGK